METFAERVWILCGAGLVEEVGVNILLENDLNVNLTEIIVETKN